jgi:hypothetical protein
MQYDTSGRIGETEKVRKSQKNLIFWYPDILCEPKSVNIGNYIII